MLGRSYARECAVVLVGAIGGGKVVEPGFVGSWAPAMVGVWFAAEGLARGYCLG